MKAMDAEEVDVGVCLKDVYWFMFFILDHNLQINMNVLRHKINLQFLNKIFRFYSINAGLCAYFPCSDLIIYDGVHIVNHVLASWIIVPVLSR